MRPWISTVCLSLCACAGSPPPETKSPDEAKTSAASATPEEKSTSGASGSGESSEFHADVIEVRDSGESAPYKSVKMRFSNPSGKACEVSQYELTWPGGRKLVNGERSSSFQKFIVPAGATRQRSLRVHPSDGETSSLDVAGAKLHADCN
jgi:hypothetical protein